MDTPHSKSALLYKQVRRGLQSGRYLPGQRIDPGKLAQEFRTSPTPVRFALYRLVGEGLVIDHARDGLHVPLPTELGMRDLYDWMDRLLAMACSLVAAKRLRRNGGLILKSPDDDLVKRTWQLFDAIAQASGQRALHEAVRRANGQLAPIRRAKGALFEDGFDELAALNRLWQARDIPALKTALRRYHARRQQRVPQIVAALHDGLRRLH